MSWRRSIRRAGGRGSAGGAQKFVYGLNGFTSANYYKTANGEGLDGSTSFWVAHMFRLDADTAPTQVPIANGNLGATNPGWGIVKASSTIYLQMADGVSNAILSPAHTIVAGDIGKTHVVVGVHDGSNLRLYWNGTEVGSGTAITGYTGIGASRYTSIGDRRTPGLPAVDYTFIGAAGSDIASISAANVATLTASYKAAGKVTDIHSPELRWDVKTNGSDAPTEWIELEAGTENMDENGTVTATGAFVPVWGS